MRFNKLIDIINETHSILQQKAASAVNQGLTIRNWLIGFYIFEFEQNGADRAKYGDRLLEKIAESTINIRGLSLRNLKLCRQFYTKYLQIGQTVSAQLQMADFCPRRRTFGNLFKMKLPREGFSWACFLAAKNTKGREGLKIRISSFILRIYFGFMLQILL